MEIKFDHVYGKELSNLNFTIPDGLITGITGHGKTTILEMIDLLIPMRGNIYFDQMKKTKQNKTQLRKEVALVSEMFINQFELDNIYEYFVYYLNYYQLPIDHVETRIKGSFKIVGLEEELLTKSFYQLSASDMKLVQLALAFLSNPKVILLDEPFINLDEKQEKKVVRILEKLKDKFHKTIVIASSNSNCLYQYTNYLIVLNEGTVLCEGNTEMIYFEEEALVKHQIERPEIVEFIQLVEEKKGIKLDRRKDVRDVIKDIYRNV